MVGSFQIHEHQLAHDARRFRSATRDIILLTRDAKPSKRVRVATKSDVSHAMIYVEACSVIDSDTDGVHANNTQRLFWPTQCAAHALRMRRKLSDDQLQKIITYARSQIGTRYTYFGAARSMPLVKPLSSESDSPRQFCSRLVARAYEYAGLRLVESPDFCTPEDLKQSSLLFEIPHAIITASEEHMSAINNVIDITKIMRDTTSAVLSGARGISDKIESLNDIDGYLVAYPEHDAEISQLYLESGYLAVWKIECDKNPWHYDLDLMLAIHGRDTQLREYCETILVDQDASLQRFEVNRAGYSILLERHGLKTFRLLKELNEKLIDLHAKRCEVALKWLSSRVPDSNFISAPKSAVHIPHSTEWFAALERFNPTQAAHTHLVIERAGTPVCCSVCGDTPSKNYRLVGHDLGEDAVSTLRLCDDCWDIRRGTYMESQGLL